MSASKKAAEVVTEVVADAAGEVALQAEQMENFVRSMNKVKVQFGLLGVAAGSAAGAMVAFFVAYRKAETKYGKIADEEIAEMQAHYQAKATALETDVAKPSIDEIVAERGYASPEESTPPPMAIQPPPASLREREEEPSGDEVVERSVFDNATITHKWDWDTERGNRSPDIPYVIHEEERFDFEDHHEATLTYYAGDDVLCNDRDEIIDVADRDKLVGEKNLDRFGHGSGDVSIVYVRNEAVEVLYEIVRSPNRYDVEVHGIKHDAYDRGNLRRMRMRERDGE